MAYTNASALIASIKQEVGRDANKIARGVAQIAFSDLQIAHSEIMNYFYSGYTPVKSYQFFYEKNGRLFNGVAHGYRRTGNLRENSIIPQGVTPSGAHGFKATVQIGSAAMDDYTNSAGRVFPASGVFDLMWNQGVRGLPPGYIGHIEEFSINAAPVGVWITGKPDEAMREFIENWGFTRGAQVADQIAFSI